MNLSQKIAAFDPNGPGQVDANIFGLPFDVEESACVVVPVPWEVTVSYGGGTLRGPAAMLDASRQIDLFDPVLPGGWKQGIAMEKIPAGMAARSRILRSQAARCIGMQEKGKSPGDPAVRKLTASVNEGCRIMVEEVKTRTSRHLDAGKAVALVGGDHSTPLGFLQALAARHRSFGVLQIDAHADLRDAYEGFTYSHASIMFNALKIPQIKRLVQAGIRDYCEAEVEFIRRARGRVVTHYDRDIKAALYQGKPVDAIHRAIIRSLPREVYVSFDIDGLDPKLCPNTGTPVPGGFEFEEAIRLVQAVVDSGRRIIGLDINEVSPGRDEWDANVGARLLYRLINLMLASRATKRQAKQRG